MSWAPTVSLAKDPRALLSGKIEAMLKFSEAQLPLPSLSENIDQQEAMILEDILYVLLGCEGNYIRFSNSYNPGNRLDRLRGPGFRIPRNMDPSLMDLTLSITDIAKHYIALEAFVEYQGSPTFGLVNQALCASIRKLLKEYVLLVAHFEQQLLHQNSFTLHTLNVELLNMSNVLRHCYDTAQVILRENDKKRGQAKHAMDVEELLESVKDYHNFRYLDSFSSNASLVCKGGSVLRLLSMRLEKYAGDPTAKALLERLLRDSSVPYLKMLEQWIYKGLIDDPYDEFLVVQTETLDTDKLDLDFVDEYWDRRYQIRKHDLPLELSNPDLYEKILLTGKYLNVVRECGGVGAEATDTKQQSFFSIEDSKIAVVVTQSYYAANQTLLRLLIDTHGLGSWMQSLRHHFFLDQADFFTNFLEIASDKLEQPIEEASVVKIQYLLDMALRQPGTISSDDPYKDRVLVSLNPDSLTKQLTDIVGITGINPEQVRQLGTGTLNLQNMIKPQDSKKHKSLDALSGLEFDFNIPFPVSLVLSQNSLIRYKILFRNLVGLKNAEINLNEVWQELAKSKVWGHSTRIKALHDWKSDTHRTRTLMLLVIQQLTYYCTMEVLDTNWNKLVGSLPTFKSVDLLRNAHIGSLDTCMKDCMLLLPSLFTRQERLLKSCRVFAQFMKDAERAILIVDPSSIPDVSQRMAYLDKLPILTDIPDTPEDQMDFLLHYYKKISATFEQALRSFVRNLGHASMENSVFMSLTVSLEYLLPEQTDGNTGTDSNNNSNSNNYPQHGTA